MSAQLTNVQSFAVEVLINNSAWQKLGTTAPEPLDEDAARQIRDSYAQAHPDNQFRAVRYTREVLS